MTGDESWLEEFDDDEQFDEDQRFDEEDQHENAVDRFEQPSGRQKQGMSTGVKVLIILLCVGGGSFVLCCGGGIYWFSSNFNASVDPAAVEEVTAEIAEIEIPDGFQPMQSVSFNMGFFTMNTAQYQSDAGDGILLLMQATLPFDDSKEQEDEMRRQLRRRNFGERELNIISSESREFEIRGEPVKFLFSEAEDPASDVAYRQITGSFPGKEGVAMLILQVPAEGYEEETFVKMIESIR